ncbi:MAG TPA: hypothetical protein VGG39_13525 [Polyangiaceae bacterium]|jgi:hypothetical protein
MEVRDIRPVRDPVVVIREHLATWDTPFVELDVFGTDDPRAIAAAVDEFARAQLGAGVAGYLLQVASISSTHCVELDDGRRLVIKVKPPAETNPSLPLDRASLEAITQAQSHLAASGFPCPMPVLGPTPLARGLATVERYMADGEHRDAHDPVVRRLLAEGLAEHMAILEPLVATSALSHFQMPPGRLFPHPHSRLFHPSDAVDDTGCVQDLARRARAIAESIASPPCLGHCDWRTEHVRFDGDRIVATYDWDSLGVLPRTRIVGVDAHGHTADWQQDAIPHLPTYDGIVGFIEDFARAATAPFTADEHRAARAWAAYWIAYSAWITIQPGQRTWAPDSWPLLLRDCGERLLA